MLEEGATVRTVYTGYKDVIHEEQFCRPPTVNHRLLTGGYKAEQTRVAAVVLSSSFLVNAHSILHNSTTLAQICSTRYDGNILGKHSFGQGKSIQFFTNI